MPYFKDGMRRCPCVCLILRMDGTLCRFRPQNCHILRTHCAAVHVFGIFHGRLASLSTFWAIFMDGRSFLPPPSMFSAFFMDDLCRCPRFCLILRMKGPLCRFRPQKCHILRTPCAAVHVLGDFYGWQFNFAAAVLVFGIIHGRLASPSTFLALFMDGWAIQNRQRRPASASR